MRLEVCGGEYSVWPEGCDGYLFVAVKDACKVPEQSTPEYVPLIWLLAAFTDANPLKFPEQNVP
jgi:hypothetical protein